MLGEKGTILVEATSAAAGADGGTFATFNATPILMQVVASDVIGTACGKSFKVVNTRKAGVSSGDKLLVTKTVQGFFVTIPDSPFNASRIKFVATSSVIDRVFSATGLEGVEGTIEVHDPHNLWSTVTAGCVGTAFLNGDEVYEVETCSLPANEIEVTLPDTLKATDADGEAVVSDAYYLRSSYPNVMQPPLNECEGSSTYTWTGIAWTLYEACPNGCICDNPPVDPPEDPEDIERVCPCVSDEENPLVEFSNPWKLDAICESKAILRRISNADWGKSSPESPAVGSSSAYRWEVVQVEKRKARWIQFEYTGGGSVEISSYWEGEDPSTCDSVTVSFPLGEPCDGDPVIAFYDPNTDVYQSVSTQSAMLGPPVVRSFVTNVAGSDCGISKTTLAAMVFKTECDQDPAGTTTSVPLGTDVPVMLSASSEECGTINYAYQTIRAFLCDAEGEPTGPSFSSFPIDFGDMKFAVGAYFGEATCSGNATFTWNTETSQYDLTTPCPSGCEPTSIPIGPPASSAEDVIEVPCGAPTGSGCGLNLQMMGMGESCEYGATPQIVHIPLPLQSLTVLTEAELAGDLTFTKSTIYVCAYEGANPTVIEGNPCDGGGP
jgi:hypothetical protein